MMTLLAPDGSREELKPGGWEHFSSPRSPKRRGHDDPATINRFDPLADSLKTMRDATKIIRSTLTRSAPGEPLHAGPVFAAPYHTPGDPSDTPYTYARSHNPTWTSLEKAIGQMESGATSYRAERSGLRLGHGGLYRGLRSHAATGRRGRSAL